MGTWRVPAVWPSRNYSVEVRRQQLWWMWGCSYSLNCFYHIMFACPLSWLSRRGPSLWCHCRQAAALGMAPGSHGGAIWQRGYAGHKKPSSCSLAWDAIVRTMPTGFAEAILQMPSCSHYASIHEVWRVSDLGFVFWNGWTLLAQYPVMVSQMPTILCCVLYGHTICIILLTCLLCKGCINDFFIRLHCRVLCPSPLEYNGDPHGYHDVIHSHGNKP